MSILKEAKTSALGATKTLRKAPVRALKDAKHLGRDLKSGLLRTPARLPKRLLGIGGRSLGDVKGAAKLPLKSAKLPLKLLKKIF